MRRLIFPIFLGIVVFAALSSPELVGQNAVCNPIFQTQNLQHWNNLDPTLAVVTGPSNLGMDGYCVQKYPGTPSNNNSMTQEVHLLAGFTYDFSADIAAKYCSS